MSSLSVLSDQSPRRARRAYVRLPVHVHRAGHSLRGETVNISRTGLLFSVKEPLREHEFCILSVSAKTIEQVDLAGHVLRSVDDEEHERCYALELHGHDADNQRGWEELLRAIFLAQHIPGALHLSPSLDMLVAMHDSLVQRDALWVPLGRPAPLHIAFCVILHHPISHARFELPVIASANQHGCTLLTLSATASPAIPHNLHHFITSSGAVLHS